MQVMLAYGRTGLVVEVPDDRTDVVEPVYRPGIADEQRAVREALRAPLGSLPLAQTVSATDRVVIVVNDGTRPMPSARVLPSILEQLAAVPRDRITLLVATGTHRANTPEELEAMLGAEILHAYRIINHDARDPAMLRFLGRTRRGHPVWLNRHYLEATVRISTGFIEPHFFAGYSGGPKPVMPGLAGLETVLYNHGPRLIADPRATFGELAGNPIHEEQLEIALMAPPTCCVNVTLNREHRLTGVWAGEMRAVHAAGVAFVRETAIRRLDREYEVVLTTNSGYPLDQNLYQTVKGMAAAARVVRQGGTIVAAAECSDGLPDHGTYAEILRGASDPDDVLARVEHATPPLADGWQAQIQAQVQRRARVALYSTLPDALVRAAQLEPVHDVAEAVRTALVTQGPAARLLVLPQGPQTICLPA
jgi:nickel-dependent lactate racemase